MSPDCDVEELFYRALERPPGERDSFLEDACGEDCALRREVEALLDAARDADQGGLLATRELVGFAGVAARAAAEQVEEEQCAADGPTKECAQRIGRYRLLQRIGEGGFGTVYMAEQTEPVRRRVAVKILKPGMDTRQVVARFEAERQALAMMDHPHIARVFDGGETERGLPYFVMELVRGTPITEFCDRERLNNRARLQLFVQVCRAVQHAHQKGIIHRDLKPSNVLVTLPEGEEPVPKVIDFGVAKAVDSRLTDKTLFTRFEQMIGTPAYMSPEQAGAEGTLDIDTRADIYALGVLLFELLTGSTPFEEATSAPAAFEDIRRILRETDAPRPSARISSFNLDRRSVVASRHATGEAGLRRELRGDLDWIVMKALEKDRRRRYETANALAADVARHLANEPVSAGPPTAAYLIGKFARRHTLAFRFAAMVLVLLIASTLVSSWQAVRATRAEELANTETERAQAALNELRETAPAFLAQARRLAEQERFDEAIEKLDYATTLRPDVAMYYLTKADLLRCQLKLAEAAAVYREALRLDPGLVRAQVSAEFCDQLLDAEPGGDGGLSQESLAKLHTAMQELQRPAAELMPVARLLGEEQKLLREYWLGRLKELPVSAAKPLDERLTVRGDGLLSLDLSHTKVVDLSPLEGAPLGLLNLDHCKELSDLSPLTAIHSLETLNLANTKVINLSPIGGLRLKVLNCKNCEISDLNPIRGMPLEIIYLFGTRVADLSPLNGMPIKEIDLTATPVLDFSALAHFPLERCYLQQNRITDLGVLKGKPLRELSLWGCVDARNYSALTEIDTLELLLLPATYRELPREDYEAIRSLRELPRLRQIGAKIMNQMGYAATGSSDVFWDAWDRREAVTKTLSKLGFDYNLTELSGGSYRLELWDQQLEDLSCLKDAPIQELVLTGTGVTDLSPLENLPLTLLHIRRTPVRDLSPLRAPVLSASLRELAIWKIPANDFSPLEACRNLEVLDAADTALADIEFLRGMKLRDVSFRLTGVSDISVLAGMPLKRVLLDGTDIVDVSPLLECPSLMEAVLSEGVPNAESLSSLPLLTGPRSVPDSRLTLKTIAKLAAESALDPDDSLLAMKVVALQLWFGENEDYAANCERIIGLAEQAPRDVDVRERAAKNWCLSPSSDPNLLPRVLALVREAARVELYPGQRPWYLQALGMGEFRAGNTEAAETAFLKAERAAETDNWKPHLRPFIQAPSRLYRAMIYSQQGKHEEAKQLFYQAEAQMPPIPYNAATVLPPDVDQDYLLCWLTYKEAKTMLGL